MPEWTGDQRRVLEAKNRNVLVSAAAGSGKTTVLIERIMRLITDPEKPVDVDRLLIVTFTEAAAGEMRSRLRKSLSELLKEHPEDTRLHRQLLLLSRAHVSTIDSFCSWVLRNYFHVIDLEPGFRVADEAEAGLLRSDVMADLLEDEYRKGEQSFIDFTEAVSARKKSDEGVEDLILRLYRFSQSAPYPEEWLKNCLGAYLAETPEALEREEWFRRYLLEKRREIREVRRGYDRLLEMCNAPGGPSFCAEDFRKEAELIRLSAEAETYGELQARMAAVPFPDKKRAPKGFPVDAELNKKVTRFRSGLRDRFRKIRSETGKSLQDVLGEIRATEPEVRELCRLTGRFTEEFRKAKAKKNLVDFSDMEHLTIQILRNPDHSRSEVAKALASRFEEVMIDEYQDSNNVQEEILTAVSRIGDGRNNMFMVGDMKQSIYRFRMARPELFMDKYESFTAEESPSQKIELHANFRSRREVVEGVNFFFRQLMHRELGGIEYDSAAELRAEAAYESCPEADYSTELLLITQNEAEDAEVSDDTGDPPEKRELEIRAAAQEILRITDPDSGLLLQDRGADGKTRFRRAEYRDIVLLARSIKEYENLLPEIFLSCGIPVFLKSSTGYFETWEIRLLLNLLRVTDNPIEDIPLAAVLRSPLFGFTAAELAEIRLKDRTASGESGFYGALKRFAAGREAVNGNEALSRRAEAFLRKLTLYREQSRKLTVSALIRFILADTELETFVSAMRGGEQRRDNIIALLEKAEAFENSSYHGLFQFIRYIERLKQTSIDEGGANSLGEEDNVVRLMTIHASKGLEFPVVLVMGLSKQFNAEDERAAAFFHPDFGIGMNHVDLGTRVRTKTLIRDAFLSSGRSEALGEELRVLYVAMTRAEQKLCLVGVCPKRFAPGEQEEIWESPAEPLSAAALSEKKSYFEWLTAAYREESPVSLRLLPGSDVMRAAGEDPGEEGEEEDTGADGAPELFRELSEPDPASEPFLREIREVLTGNYLYDELRLVRSTMSVSLLKEMAAKLREEKGGIFDEEEAAAVVDDIPAARTFRKGRKAAAAHGTLVHLLFEKMIPGEKAETALQRLTEAGAVTAEQAADIDRRSFDAFYESELGKRVVSAYERGEAYRERRFIIGLPVRDVLPSVRFGGGERARDTENELLMLQGTTDLYFEEDGALVLVDYKTDRVKTAAELAERYSVQLKLYERALRQSTGKPVKEKWIWSTALRQAVRLP